MRKIIWTCWFQGLGQAPELVRKCLASWQERNPGWDFRLLDAGTISRYVDLDAHFDLERQSITAASLSDILRVLLLHEYGGVWADATTFCNVPLDDWLPSAAGTGFFAFARPAEARPPVGREMGRARRPILARARAEHGLLLVSSSVRRALRQ